MIVFRLSKSRYSRDLSGCGARKSGGRWNSKGVSMIYTSESRALCTAEIAVHTPLGNLPPDYDLITLFIEDQVKIFELKPSDLPKNWKEHLTSTQRAGDEFIRQANYLIMKVPSAVVQGDSNFLLNPDHPEIGKVKIQKTEGFGFDKRLFIR
jgi:RES domain-containing protein